jgi:hypothetical protein
MRPAWRFALLLFVLGPSHAAEVARLASPDSHNTITVDLDEAGVPTYRVRQERQKALGASPLEVMAVLKQDG